MKIDISINVCKGTCKSTYSKCRWEQFNMSDPYYSCFMFSLMALNAQIPVAGDNVFHGLQSLQPNLI